MTELRNPVISDRENNLPSISPPPSVYVLMISCLYFVFQKIISRKMMKLAGENQIRCHLISQQTPQNQKAFYYTVTVRGDIFRTKQTKWLRASGCCLGRYQHRPGGPLLVEGPSSVTAWVLGPPLSLFLKQAHSAVRHRTSSMQRETLRVQLLQLSELQASRMITSFLITIPLSGSNTRK